MANEDLLCFRCANLKDRKTTRGTYHYCDKSLDECEVLKNGVCAGYYSR
jgi:hypothetical protein